MKLSELRKELKSIGFKLKVKTMSWGPHITFYHIAGEQRPQIYHTQDQFDKWFPLNDWLTNHQSEIAELKKEYYGLN
jgi:hypothetical protein